MNARDSCNNISVVLCGFRFRAARTTAVTPRHLCSCSYLMQLLLIRMRYIGSEIKLNHQQQPFSPKSHFQANSCPHSKQLIEQH